MKTVRRDWLRRQVEAGKVRVVGSYDYDDMTGASRDAAKGMLAAISPGDWRQRKPGICYLHPTDFDTSSGRAWQDPDGSIVLYVHSNSNYTLRIDGSPPYPVEANASRQTEGLTPA